MARAYPNTEISDPASGDWHALRGELVALLDRVESKYSGQTAPDPVGAALSQRVRHLRDQVEAPEANPRRREALRSVKQTADRFSERDAHGSQEDDDLTAAISEIRRRQGPAAVPAMGRRATDMPDFRDLSALVSGMSMRLEQLEGDLKEQRSNEDQVDDVAEQVEQLTQVVELLAGAVGETGQVKRLEAQMAALGEMIENTPKVDLSAVNQRLDDVSATVGKLAELQAEQMEREIVREERLARKPEPTAALAPAMHSIEESVRNVYDRIDAIERNFAMSSVDFEKLTSEMAAFTQAMSSGDSAPAALVERVEALAEALENADNGNNEVAALRGDMVALREAVIAGMEPRFAQIEDRIDALNDKIVPVDTSGVESQLRELMARMDAAGTQLDGLARLYTNAQPDFESLAMMVAERTSDAVARKTPAPVATLGPDSLKGIEERIDELIRSAGKPADYDYETLANLVANRTSAAVAKAASTTSSELGKDSMDALEKRMTAVLNTAGKETADRLKRLEATLAARREPVSAPRSDAPVARSSAAVPAPSAKGSAETTQPAQTEATRLDTILAGLLEDRKDAMPASPAQDAPLVDQGFRHAAASQSTPTVKAAARTEPARPAQVSEERPQLDTAQIERPPRPQSSFAPQESDFATPAPSKSAAPEAPAAAASTSTFVAAARRAQRARQEEAQASASDSLVARALSRVRTGKADDGETVQEETSAPEALESEWPEAESREPTQPAKLTKAEKRAAAKQARAEAAKPAPRAADTEARPGFLARNRRPLLLAATLAAVSLLALNLVLQRTNAPAQSALTGVANDIVVPDVAVDTPATPAAAAAPSTPEPALAEPVAPPTTAVEPVAPAGVDPTSTQSINPEPAMSVSDAATLTPMPPALLADSLRSTSYRIPAMPENGSEPATTGSIPDTAAALAAERFDLPPETVGPEPMRQAAADGDARAQFEVAAIYTEGRAVEQDLKEAAKWYERSAERDFVPAQYRLGNLYEAGTGVEKNLDTAKTWYEKAAEGGNRMAMHNLAALYAGGQLGEQQFELAAEWFEKAAARGMLDSQFNLGMLYARGLGVEQDFEKSYKWFSIAALTGDKDAAQAKDDIAKSLTAEAVSRIDDDVAAWQPERIELSANFAPIGTWSTEFDPGKTIESKDVVSKVQVALNKLGFDVGAADGLMGPKTVEAVREFERGTGMSESGEINPRLLAVLGSQPV